MGRYGWCLGAGFVLLSYGAAAYPGGVPEYVTDTGPFCASCHSSVGQAMVRNLPIDDPGRRELEKVHYEAITKGAGPYKDLTPEQRTTLVEQIQALDKKASVSLQLPKAVIPGSALEVKVTVTGGDGPVVGLMLLDSDLRYQARPIASSGWFILKEPDIVGPDGKPQTTWLDRRVAGSPRNLNFVQVYGIKGDGAPATITYTVKAPTTKGVYPLAVALLYGVEVGTALGTVGDGMPRGGFGGRSGRVLISPLQTITVR